MKVDDAVVQKVSLEGRIANNLIFLFADMIETVYGAAKYQAHIKDVKFDAKTRAAMMRLNFAAQDLRRRTRELGDDNQLTFGEESDALLKLLITAIDRCGRDSEFIYKIIESVESYESKYKLRFKIFGL